MSQKYCFLFLMILINFFSGGCATEPNPVNPIQTDNSSVEGGETSKTLEPQKKPTATFSANELEFSGYSLPILLIGIEEPPFAPITASIKTAVEDSVSEIHSSGRLLGAEVMLHYAKTQNNSEAIRDTFTENVKRLNPLVVLMAAPIDPELVAEIQHLQVPVLYYGLGGAVIRYPKEDLNFIYWLTPFPDEQFAFYLDQIWKNWEQLRPPGTMNEFRVGYLTWDERPSNLSITPEAARYFQKNNYNFVTGKTIRNSQSASATNFLLDCITAGVNIQYTDTFNYGPMILLNDIQSLGLNDFFVVGGSVWSYDQASSTYLVAPQNSEAFFIPLPIKWWSEDSLPSITRANEIMDLAGRSDQEKNFSYLLSLGAMDIVEYLIKELLVRARKSDLSPQDFYDELNNLENYSVLNGLFEVSYANGNRSPRLLRLWAVSAGESWIPIGDTETVPVLGLNSGD